MGYSGTLICNVTVGETSVGLGESEPEELDLKSHGGRSAQIAFKEGGDEFVTVDIAFPASQDEQPDIVVVSASKYEYEYEDQGCRAKSSIRYQLEGMAADEWICLKNAHVYKARNTIAPLDIYGKKIKFQLLNKAIPKDAPADVEVYLGSVEKSTAPETLQQKGN